MRSSIEILILRAARRHGLDFIPLVTERYLIAMRATTLARPATRALLDAMKRAAFRGLLKALPGYAAPEIGELISVREALRSA